MYLDECRKVLQHIEQAEAKGRHQRDVPSGVVKVAMHPAFRLAFFTEAWRFLASYEDIKLETRMTNSTSVLFEEGFDVLIRAGELPDSTLVARRIGWVDLIVGAAPGYLAKYGTPKTPADLEHHRWAVPARVDDGSGPHYEFVKGRKRCSITVHPRVKMRDGAGLVAGQVAARSSPVSRRRLRTGGRTRPRSATRSRLEDARARCTRSFPMRNPSRQK